MLDFVQKATRPQAGQRSAAAEFVSLSIGIPSESRSYGSGMLPFPGYFQYTTKTRWGQASPGQMIAL